MCSQCATQKRHAGSNCHPPVSPIPEYPQKCSNERPQRYDGIQLTDFVMLNVDTFESQFWKVWAGLLIFSNGLAFDIPDIRDHNVLCNHLY